MIKDAYWIGMADGGDICPEFIKHFKVKTTIREAMLTITAIGVYEAQLNGKRIGDFILAPGCTAYNKRLQYQTYDITDMITDSNILSVTVGKGWHRSRMSENRPEINTKPCAIIAEIVIEYVNGETEIILTDKSWTVRNSRVIFNDIWDGETYDASLEPEVSKTVSVIDLDKNILIPQEGETVREQEILYPKELIITPKGEKVFDFGQEITGYVEFTIDAQKGDIVEWSCAEVLDKEGNFYNDNYRSAKSKLSYICRDGAQSYKPRFTFYGFRYIRIDKYPSEVKLEDFRAIAVYSDMERTGFVRTSNEKLNKLFQNALWSQRDNFLDIPTDCPQRDERMGWTGDAQVFAKTACYNYNAKKFFEKWLGDLRAEQRENGSVPDTVPNFWKIMRSSSAWGDVINVIAWQLYVMYGDKKTLEANLDAMRRWVDFMTNDSLDKYLWTCPDDSDKKWRKHYGDWLALDAPEGSYRGSTPDNFIASAFYAYSTELLIKAGNALGKDMTEYEELYKNIVSAFKKSFNKFTTQTEHILALVFNLTDNKAETAKSLADMIKANGNKLQTGFVGTPYLLYALSENGYADVAYDLLFQEEYPSWLYEVNHGATTIWEHWDGIKEDGSFWSDDMNSYNHYAYGSVMDWVYSVAGGIKPDENYAGFEQAVIAPVPDKRLEWIDVSVKTRRGIIKSKWTCESKGIRYDIETPVKTRIIIDRKQYDVEKGCYVFYGKNDVDKGVNDYARE
ncbi:MAG: family 78 glycoside hydrolase catalytic domain [Clostridia bacterium]|nr:family 78 glycoside hydrolase catalytic domain [Clostridia bacterium]